MGAQRVSAQTGPAIQGNHRSAEPNLRMLRVRHGGGEAEWQVDKKSQNTSSQDWLAWRAKMLLHPAAWFCNIWGASQLPYYNNKKKEKKTDL